MSDDQVPDAPGEGDVPHDPTGLDLAAQIARQTAGGHVALPPPMAPRRPRQRRSRLFEEQRSGARPDDRDPQPLGDVLDNISRKRGWRRRISLSTVLQRWCDLVGTDNAEHSQPVDFAGGVLIVQCDSTAWATGMRYAAPQIVARLNTELGDQTVKRIDVRGPNAPSWKKGIRSVRDGRGPRDTYG